METHLPAILPESLTSHHDLDMCYLVYSSQQYISTNGKLDISTSNWTTFFAISKALCFKLRAFRWIELRQSLISEFLFGAKLLKVAASIFCLVCSEQFIHQGPLDCLLKGVKPIVMHHFDPFYQSHFHFVEDKKAEYCWNLALQHIPSGLNCNAKPAVRFKQLWWDLCSELNVRLIKT